MEQKFKLKKEARQFFDEYLHRRTQSLESWAEANIPIQLLDKTDLCYVYFGYDEETEDRIHTILTQWENDGKKADFRFTLRIEDMESADYHKVKISEVMDEIQKVVNEYFKYK